MAMLGFDAVSSYLLVVSLATLLVAILVWQPFRSKRTVNVWLASSVVGAVLGSVIPCAMMELNGYALTKSATPASGESGGTGASCSAMRNGMSSGGGMSGMGCGMGKSGMAMSGGPAKICPMTGKPMGDMKGTQGAGTADKPHPKADLTALVQKLNLLTGDIGITLSAAQAAAVSDCLRDVEKSAKMSDEDGKAKHNQLMALLNEKQKASLEAIGLPQSAHHCETAMASDKGCCGTSSATAAKPEENQNPFQQDAESKAVKSLRERLAAKTIAAKSPVAKP